MKLRKWTDIGYCIVVPNARAHAIRCQYSSDDDQRRHGANYYVNVNPWASWEDFADEIYQCKLNRAIVAFKTQLPKQKGNQCDHIEHGEVRVYI